MDQYNNTPLNKNKLRHSLIDKNKFDKSFNKTMTSIREKMPHQNKITSIVFHNKVVCKTLDLIEIIINPISLLSTTVCLLISSFTSIAISKIFGYGINSNIILISMPIGYLLGLLILAVLNASKKYNIKNN